MFRLFRLSLAHPEAARQEDVTDFVRHAGIDDKIPQLPQPRGRVTGFFAKFLPGGVPQLESLTSAAGQLIGALSTRVAVLSNQHHFALAGNGHDHHGRGHGEKRIAEPMAARPDLYVVLFQRDPTIVVNSPGANFFIGGFDIRRYTIRVSYIARY